ncbi:YicC/YloC family endoribonuclease [Acetobacterium malicum]|uniref:YicC family protein n=1 Tax=Acetobacterium malicum TaxID=52692 RepID=A0ABR6YT91_9FIRM|nr:MULTISPECIES: YicC/YloC family endoribonuclease [Acetobacterium]MBC3898315.1 YicC family protein [Acetobacterium malicum]
MKSMTGFGRKDYRDEEIDCSIEIKTINHRFRDFFVKIPKTLNPIEEKIRNTVSQSVARGRIEIFIKYTELGTKNRRIVFNRDLAKNYISVLNEIRRLDSMIGDDLSLSLISKFPDVIMIEEDIDDYESIWLKIQPVLEKTLEEVDASREREGSALKKDVVNRCCIVRDHVKKIKEKSPDMLVRYRDELREKISSYVESVEIDEKRLLTEVALMTDKLNIDEELTRLQSHLDRLEDMVEETEPVGRKLDFLIQEVNREINTIGSKASDLAIANIVVDVKSEIEKIREQIQNIE